MRGRRLRARRVERTGERQLQPRRRRARGLRLAIICQAVGQTTIGANGASSAIWDRLSTGGFVPDFYVNTPNVGSFSPPIPPCRDLSARAP